MSWIHRPESADAEGGRFQGGRFRGGKFRGGGFRGPRFRHRHLHALPVLIGAIQILGSRFSQQRGESDYVLALDQWAYALLVCGPIALLLRHRLPPLAVVGAFVPTVAYFALGYPRGPAFLSAVVVIFAAVHAGWRRFIWIAVPIAYAGYLGASLVLGTAHAGRLVTVAVWSVVVVGFAEASRLRRQRFAELARAHEEEARTAAARRDALEEQERRRASEERLRIAQELHDVIGHHLSLIHVQAGVGLHLMDERPEQARTALAAIKHASAEALRETRGVLAALRPEEQSVPLKPAPGLADLDALVADVTAAGLAVRVDQGPGGGRVLPPQVDRAAYRIIQEALTNVRRHAGPGATATVSVRYDTDALTVRVLDDGQGGAIGPGNGIVGMRERALALGGAVTAGPRQEGGFAVSATLPLPHNDREGPA
ncbi:MAG TPA: sensor histidine kinase [Micromonosporaceae bacterium]|nr:sensor histidine kinase [Micromonosporaceae bacterium]